MSGLLLGILASSLPSGGDYESIATVTVGSGGASSIEFTSIPGTYQHLQVRYILRSNTTTQEFVVIQPNSANPTARHLLYGNGASAIAAGSTSSFDVGAMPKSDNTSNAFSAGVADFLDYASTSKNKTVRIFTGYDINGSGQIMVNSIFTNATTALTSIKFVLANGTSFAQHSTAALYGIKAP